MKKAVKFSDWCYKTLSDEETKTLNNAIDTICENHESDSIRQKEKLSWN